MARSVAGAIALAIVGCSSPVAPLENAAPGVVFSYPVNGELDVPVGTRVVVTFSEAVDASALASSFAITGPGGALAITPTVSMDGKTIEVDGAPFVPGTQYSLVVQAALDPAAQNLPAGGTVATFTTRTTRPRAAAPALVSVNGSAPTSPGTYRPIIESSTISLLFSEPLDPRTVVLAPGAFELLDPSGAEVSADILTDGIHVAIDPDADLLAGETYMLKLGSAIVDRGGQAIAPTSIAIAPVDSRGSVGPIPEVLRTRQSGDPGNAAPRNGRPTNTIDLASPLIGAQTSTLLPSVLATELADPKALGGPIAFTLRKGQRLEISGLDVSLGGQIPLGVSTGNIEIELLTDGGGRMYRNPNQAADQSPENDRAPLYVDLTLDVAVFTLDPTGNAVLAQTVLGLQAAGIVTATDGVLDIETVSSMELGLLGVTIAPTNLVLELITDTTATPAADTTPPTYTVPSPPDQLRADEGVELIFSEPIDLERARAGGIELDDSTGIQVPSEIESAGSAIVVRPLAPLAYSKSYEIQFKDVRDLAGNALASTPPLALAMPFFDSTAYPLSVSAVNPGVPCSLTGGGATSPGRCSRGQGGDDLYQPFTIAADEPIVVGLTQPVNAPSITLGTACGSGSVRVEQVDTNGTCMAAVPGTIEHHDRTVTFVPDQPWVVGSSYKLTLVTDNNNASCQGGEVCGPSGAAASFDPLGGAGTGDGGGPNIVIPFTATAPTGSTFMVATASPYTDINGSAFVDAGELPSTANQAALRVVSTSGIIDDASFDGADCVPSTPQVENCIYISGATPVELGALATNCTLPDGSNAASCIPVTVTPQIMYGTSVKLSAGILDDLFTLDNDTGISILRIREPAGGGPILGYIIDGNGGPPQMKLALDLYMDAPDLDITLSDHDIHSKPLSVSLSGPVNVQPDGRIAITLTNDADVPVTVNISGPLGTSGTIGLLIPQGLMALQLVSPALRGGLK